MNKFLLTSLLAASFAMPVAGQFERSTSQRRLVKKKPRAYFGTASFYADKFNGRTTSNGAVFSGKKMTAASNIFPLNTWVRVTNLRNKRSLIVQITDRMHAGNKRIIDLSKAAARQLSYISRGITRVKVTIWLRKPGLAPGSKPHAESSSVK